MLRRPWLVALLLLGLWLAAAWVRPWLGTEARRAVVARDMLASGEFLVPRLGGELSLTKPPLHYWMQAASLGVAGESTFAARLPALVLLALVAGAFVLAGRAFGRGGDYAVAGALLLASHPVVAGFAASAEIDGAFAAWIDLSLLALAAAVLGRRRDGWVVVSGLLAGLAGLSKGPPALFFLLPAWWPAWRVLGWRRFAVWLCMCALPTLVWLLAVYVGGPWQELLDKGKEETVGRLDFVTVERLLGAPLDVARFALLLLPALLLVVVRREVDDRDHPQRLAQRVLLWGGVGGVLLFAVWPHRPTRYLFPALPPLLFVLVHATGRWLEREPDALRAVRIALRWLAMLALAGVAFVAPPWLVLAPLAACLVAVATLLPGVLSTFLALGISVQLVLFGDFALRDSAAPRELTAASRVLARTTGEADVLAWGHVQSEHLWDLWPRLRMDEWRRGQVDAPWVVFEDVPEPELLPQVAYREIVRISTRNRTLVVARVEGR
jgi:4-amino-4-deoxy-L-arabinose transferase-like glycosyltransferase